MPVDPASEYNVLEAEDGVAAQTLTGTEDQDIFVFEFDSDPNGGFAEFGEAVIDNYNINDDDQVLFIDRNNEWTEETEVINDAVQNGEDALIDFNNDPDVTLDDQSITMTDTNVASPFNTTIEDIDANFYVATDDEVQAVGLNEFIENNLLDAA